LVASKCPTAENSWFPGFAWQAVRCGGCPKPNLLGWAYTPEQGGAALMPGYFGLIITRLRERMAMVNQSCKLSLRPAILGLNAETIRSTSNPAAAAAARGIGAMPSELIPSASTPTPGLTAAESEKDAGSSCSDEEHRDFQAQRRFRRRESQRLCGGAPKSAPCPQLQHPRRRRRAFLAALPPLSTKALPRGVRVDAAGECG